MKFEWAPDVAPLRVRRNWTVNEPSNRKDAVLSSSRSISREDEYFAEPSTSI
jgi:hypothetical protein